MSQPRRFHLFNCDNIYELSVVEDLLNAAKAKLGFEFSVEKHNFTLSEMSELSTKTIPEMQMDFAMFVVHAHESVLLINNDNLELGYAKVYRALMQAAGGNVIIVIGGDDNYRNEDEEDQVVISHWAKRKIFSQFSNEYLDGRKSFIFSWNEKHRPIHEEALRHYFDPSKKGQKFEYQSKPRKGGSSKTAQSFNPRNPLYKAHSMDEQRGEDRSFVLSYSVGQKGQDSFTSSTKSAEERGEEGLFPRSNSVVQRGEYLSFSHTESAQEKREGNLFGDPKSAEQRYEDSLFGPPSRAGQRTEYGTVGPNTAHFSNVRGARPKQMPAASSTKSKGENVVSDMRGSQKRKDQIDPSSSHTSSDNPNLCSEQPGCMQLRKVHLFNCDCTYKFDSVEDLLTKAKVSFYLVEKHRFTLGQMSEMITKIPSLGMDLAFFVVHAHEDRLSINEVNAGIGYAKIYRALLKATGGNVIIVIGGDDNYRNEDEEDQVVISRRAKRKVSSQFEEEFLDGSKSFIFSWNKKHRPIREEALRHFFDENKKGQKFEYQPPKRKLADPSGDHVIKHAQEDTQQQETQGAEAFQQSNSPTANGEPVLLKSILRYGRISYQPSDVQICYPGFRVPDCISQSLLQKHQNTPEAEVKIAKENNGELRVTVSVEPRSKEFSPIERIQIAPSETLMLETRLRYGKLSFERGDLRFIYPNWQIPLFIVESLKREYETTPNGLIYVFTDEQGNLRYKVQIGRRDKALDFAKKLSKN